MARITIRENKVGNTGNGVLEIHDHGKLIYIHVHEGVFGIVGAQRGGCGRDEKKSQSGARGWILVRTINKQHVELHTGAASKYR